MSEIPPGLHRERTKSLPRPVETVSFRFRTRWIQGTGQVYNSKHHNVRRLEMQSYRIDKIVTAAFALCPKFTQHYLRKWFPEWYLPPNIVLKTEKLRWEREFDSEIACYTALQSLQGTYVPQYFGLAKYMGVRSHVLSDVGGISMSYIDEDDEAVVPVVEDLFRNSISAVASLGYYQNDMKLDNFHLVGNRIVLVDLEQFGRFAPKVNFDNVNKHLLRKMMKEFCSYQEKIRMGCISDLADD
ncbi:hypothetical protein ACHAQJ_010473 [Trichoderma viride]